MICFTNDNVSLSLSQSNTYWNNAYDSILSYLQLNIILLIICSLEVTICKLLLTNMKLEILKLNSAIIPMKPFQMSNFYANYYYYCTYCYNKHILTQLQFVCETRARILSLLVAYIYLPNYTYISHYQ